jgi:hypothetical protein
MLKKAASMEKVEARMSALDFHLTLTSACLPAGISRWVPA